MKPFIFRFAAGAALAATFAAPRAAGAQTHAATPVAPEVAAATFDTAWSVINRSLWDTTFNGVDWNGVRSELRPKAQAAKTNQELRAVLSDMVARLKLSHFGIIPGDVQQQLAAGSAASQGASGRPGMEVRLLDGRMVVTRVEKGGPAQAAGVRTGWAVQRVRGREMAGVLRLLDAVPGARDPRGRALYAWSAATHALEGGVGERVPVVFTDGGGRRVSRTLVLAPSRGVPTRFGNLPELDVTVDTQRVRTPGGATVGIIRFNYWMPSIIRPLDQAVDAFRGLDGIVIDVRGNLGGVGAMASGYAGHFVNRVDTMGVMTTRAGKMYLVTNPRTVNTRDEPVRVYGGPVAVLTDAVSVSTSEFFAGGMQALGRARVFGETSAGQALPAYAQRLPNGDVLMHAIADFTGPTGQRFEGAGVVPDVAAPPTRAALLAGRDNALAAALAWMDSQREHRGSR